MPIHDWTKAEPGTFHSFHHRWISAIADALNLGALPAGYYAMSEKFMGDGESDVLTLANTAAVYDDDRDVDSGGLALLTAPPQTKIREVADDEEIDAWKASRIIVRYRSKAIVASIEIVSPGNKSSQFAFETFIDKSAALIEKGIHLLIVDLFPPNRRDPKGIHSVLWNRFQSKSNFKVAPKKNRLLASYDAAPIKRAFVEPCGIGDKLKEMPLFLLPGRYINVPLEETYMQSWKVFPKTLRQEVE